jgi:hypothetical protein
MSLTAIDDRIRQQVEVERLLWCSRHKHRVDWRQDALTGRVEVVHGGVPLTYDPIDQRSSDVRWLAGADTSDVCRALAWPEPSDILGLFDTEGDYS